MLVTILHWETKFILSLLSMVYTESEKATFQTIQKSDDFPHLIVHCTIYKCIT